MKKNFALGITLMILILGFVTSCSKEEIPVDPIVGTWEYSETSQDFSMTVVLTFNSDKSGLSKVSYIVFGQPESHNHNFIYTADGSVLTFIVGTEITDTPYSISENKLTLNYLDEEMVLTRK